MTAIYLFSSFIALFEGNMYLVMLAKGYESYHTSAMVALQEATDMKGLEKEMNIRGLKYTVYKLSRVKFDTKD